MREDAVKAKFLSAGANRHTALADWSEDGLLAFGTDSNIALWRPHGSAHRGIQRLLSGHRDVVKAVKFLGPEQGGHLRYLLSGGDDHGLKIWALRLDDTATCMQTVEEAHAGAINCIATLGPSSSRGNRAATNGIASAESDGGIGSIRWIFATGAADAAVKIWGFDGTEVQVLQTINPTPKFFPLAIAVHRLSARGDALVMAVAGTRDAIQIYVADSAINPQFQLQATLSGHEGWMRSLDFAWEHATDDDNDRHGGDLLLASASQDKYIRLWRFHEGRDLPSAITSNGGDPSLGAYLPGKSPSNKAHRLKADQGDFSVTFEALLFGHDDWIYSAKWHASKGGKLQLLSTSADNTLAIWEADPASGIWVTTVRLGEISREKGATTATGSTGGFWTGLWSPHGSSVACLGRTGSWRVWDFDEERDHWVPAVGISGHTRAVTGIAWSKNGEYLLSTSSDQTTRLFAGWKRKEEDVDEETWHEVARPQIHGYDLNCIDSFGASRFVSGADEKLMRVFEEPKAVAKLLSRLCGISNDQQLDVDAMPDAADMPVLGLSNKAIDAVDDNDAGPAQASAGLAMHDGREVPDAGSTVRKSALDIDHPPLEDSLSRHTLWPEIEKLYGHGYEISCLAASHDGSLVASACKASSVNHAVIRLFETKTWTEVKPPLTTHALTATRLRFSPDDRYLLSVGRDRQWAVFQRSVPSTSVAEHPVEEEDDRYAHLRYRLTDNNPKGHSRMILDVAWAPLTEAEGLRIFATAGRDKQVKIWRRGPVSSARETQGGADSTKTGFTCAVAIPEPHPVTAVDFLQRKTIDGRVILAVGTEVGKISIHFFDLTSDMVMVLSSLSLRPAFCLAKAALQLAWRPGVESNELAVAGEDGSLRLYSFTDLE